jgi:hypothetical protein
MSDRGRRSNGIVTEVADLNTNRESYESNYDKIFGSKNPLMPLTIGEFYIHIGSDQKYIITGFCIDKDTDIEKVIYQDLLNNTYTRSKDRFRQKFEPYHKEVKDA